MNDIMAVTLTVVENDPMKLHSPENAEKQEMRVEAFEIFANPPQKAHLV